MPNDTDLTATLSDPVKVRDEFGTPFKPLHGFVAILDALGAKDYSREEADTFLRSRKKKTHPYKFDPNDFKRFTFNDTVILPSGRLQRSLPIQC